MAPKKRKAGEVGFDELDIKIQALGTQRVLAILKAAALKHRDVLQDIDNELPRAVSSEDIRILEQEAVEAVHQLDSLKPSQQFNMSGRVSKDLNGILGKIERWLEVGLHLDAMKALVAISAEVINPDDIEGEVWKSMACGGPIASIGTMMAKCLESMEEGQRRQFADAVLDIEDRLSDHGIEEDFSDAVALVGK